MKQSMLKRFVVSIAIALFSASLFAIDAKVESVSGKVQVQKGGAWRDLRVGEVISKGDMIQTGFKSEAVFVISSQNSSSKVKISQLSRLTIEQMVENSSGDTTSVYLTTGSVRSEIKKTKDLRTSYTVRSPVATASVRGTEFTVANGFGNTQFTTHQGVVATRPTRVSEKNVSVKNDDSQSVDVSEASFGINDVVQGQSSSFTETEQVSASSSMVSKATKIEESAISSAASREAVVTNQSPVADASAAINEVEQLTDFTVQLVLPKD